MGRCGLSSKELSRVEVMGRVKAGSLRLQEAAELPGLSYRQAKRVWARYRGGGAKAAVLVRLSPTLKATLSEIAKREHRSLSQQVEFFLERCVRVQNLEENPSEENASPGGQNYRSAVGAVKNRNK